MMNLCRSRMIAAGALSFFLVSTFAQAETLTAPTDRDSKLRIQSHVGGIATMKACKGSAPKVDISKFTKMRIGMAGAVTAPLDQLSRFLQLGLTQSYNKTYEQGWSVLRNNCQESLTAFGPLPSGIRLTLASALDASGGRSYETAYKVLHEAMKSLANNPGELATDPRTAFIAYLRIGRTSTYQKSYEEAYAIESRYMNNLANGGQDLIPSRELGVALRADIQSSGGLSYQAAWETLEVGSKHLENAPGGALATFYFRMAVQCASNKSYEYGYRILKAFVDTAIDSGLLQPFERLALESSRTASGGKSYQAAWEILRDGLNALNQ